MRKDWLIGPAAFLAMCMTLLATWAQLDPAVLVRNFDQAGYSPFEIATLPFYALIIPVVWWKCPFDGSVGRRAVLCTLVSVCAAMAIVKQLDLHLALAHWLYPDYVTAQGTMAHGLFKPDGRPLGGTPFKMRVLTNAGVPLGLKAVVCVYFAALFGTFAAGFVYLLPTWLRGVLRFDASSWSWGCFGVSGMMVEFFDRLPAWLDHMDGLGRKGGDAVTPATSFCTCFEEGSEMVLAILAIVTILLGYADSRRRRRRSGAGARGEDASDGEGDL